MKETGDSTKKSRETIVDGIFYPSEPEQLERLIAELISEAEDTDAEGPGGDPPRLIMVPHAGYEYAGRIMAAGFTAVTASRSVQAPELVVVIAPVHRERRDAVFLTESNRFLTPLGPVPVARDVITHMADCGTRIEINDIPHLEEHAIETALPFIRHLFPEAELLPIIVGSNSRTVSRLLSGALRAVAEEFPERTLFVVSSNLCSPAPPAEADRKTEACRRILTGGDLALTSARARGEISMCGAAALEGAVPAVRQIASPASSTGRMVERSVGVSGSDEKEPRVWYGAYAYFV